MRSRFCFPLFTIAWLLLTAAASNAQDPDQQIQPEVKARLSAPSEFNGLCPASMTFKGAIWARWQPYYGAPPGKPEMPRYKPFYVTYRFALSNGAKSGIKTLMFSRPTTQAVSYTWTQHSAQSGWVQLEILSPIVTSSAVATFENKCRRVDLVPELVTRVNGSRLEFSAKIKNVGDSDFVGPCCVQVLVSSSYPLGSGTGTRRLGDAPLNTPDGPIGGGIVIPAKGDFYSDVVVSTKWSWLPS